MRVQIVSFHCVLTNHLGQFISSSFNHEVTTSPVEETNSFALPGLIRALKEMKIGKKQKVFIPAHEGYGFYDPKLVITLPRSQLSRGKALKLGDQVLGRFQNETTPRSYRVVGLQNHEVTLDGNHPLAGQDLVFDLEVTESREIHEESDSEDQKQKRLSLLN